MTEIKFDNDQPSSTGPLRYRKPKGLAGFLISQGLVKDQKRANQILIFLVIALLLFSCFLIFSSGSTPAEVTEVIDAV